MNVLLKDLPKSDLPRERLVKYGVSALSNEELITILLRTGTKNVSAKTLSSNVLAYTKDISDLKNITLRDLNKIKGMGTAKSTNILAALELGRRVYEEYRIEDKIKITNAIDAYRYFSKVIEEDTQENFMVIYLDNQSQYISHKLLFKGTLNQSIVHPREIIKEALLINSNKLILMHNHPSGINTPSHSDDEVTKSIIEAGYIFSIKVLDHIIVGKNDYYSYQEEGRIKYE